MYTSYSTLQRKQLTKQVYTDTQSTYLLVYAPGRHQALEHALENQLHRKFRLVTELAPALTDSVEGVLLVSEDLECTSTALTYFAGALRTGADLVVCDAAFGFDGVLLSDGCASVWAPKTLRASMGAAVRVPVIEAGALPETIAALREKGITCLAAALYQSQPLSAAQASYPGGVCVVIGSEGQGLTDETIAACTSTVRIPMTDRVESLNAGIAGSILLWHFREESL